MNMRLAALLGSSLLLLAGCTSSPIERATKEAFSIDVTDDPKTQMFIVSLRSHDARKLCLTREQWPRGGDVFSDGVATLQTDDGTVPADAKSYGYCPGGCALVELPPGGELTERISYGAFGDPDVVARSGRRILHFTVEPFYCDAHRR